MENKKLISMVDFVWEQNTQNTSARRLSEIIGYADFLKQTPTLGDFIACDEDGNVLEEPKFFYTEENIKKLKGVEIEIAEQKNKEVVIFQQAQSKVIFKGFEAKKGYANYTETWLVIDEEFLEGKTIEDLVPYNLELKN